MPAIPRPAALIALALLTAAGVLFALIRSGQPVPLPDAPPGRLDCASYAPPRFNATDQPATAAEIDTQLRQVARRFGCIRTYSSEGMDHVPAAARAAGLRVLLGAWIGSDHRHNRRELEQMIALAKANRDVVDAVVVGNEVFLRREQTPAQLAALLREVRGRTGLPVTTADIWAFWPRDPELLDAVSFMLVHILPYWDDQPASADQVLPHVQQVYADMLRKFPGRTLMIGETGWPTRGRPRGALEPGRINAARYVREFTAWAAERGLRYNLIEAFDQPWKRAGEGTVGGYWGLLDADGREKYPLQGPVAENPRWRGQLALCLGAGALLPVLVRAGRRPVRPAALAWFGLAGVGAMGAALAQLDYLQAASRDGLDAAVTLAWAAAGWTLALAALRVCGQRLTEATAARPPVPRPADPRLIGPLFTGARFAVLLGAAYVALGLVIAGRHRDFPLALLAVPAWSLLALQWVARPGERRPPGPRESLLAAWLALAAPLVVWIEGPVNRSALATAALFLLLAWPVLGGPRRGHQHQGARQDAQGRQVKAVQHGPGHAQYQGQVSRSR